MEFILKIMKKSGGSETKFFFIINRNRKSLKVSLFEAAPSCNTNIMLPSLVFSGLVLADFYKTMTLTGLINETTDQLIYI